MGAEVDEVMAATSRLAEAQSMRQATSLQALPFVHWALLYIIAVGAHGLALDGCKGLRPYPVQHERGGQGCRQAASPTTRCCHRLRCFTLLSSSCNVDWQF